MMGGGSGVLALDAELVVDARARLAEGPLWDTSARELVWVDILGRRVHRFRPSDGRASYVATPSPVGAVGLRASGGLVLALEDGLYLSDAGDERPHLLVRPADQAPGLRFNDGKVDPLGRFWAGTMAYDARPGAGALYRLDPDARLSQVLDGVTISNGLGWSPDQRLCYFADTATQAVDRFDFHAESGAISGRRAFVDIPTHDGAPDGLTVDVEGAVWVALWGGGEVRRYRSDGALDVVVRLPVEQVSSCAFGGDDLADLYITTASEGLDHEARSRQPLAGGIFRCRPGVTGLVPSLFAG